MTHNPDIPAFTVPASTREGRRHDSSDAPPIAAVRSIRVRRSEMPKLLLAAVREDVADALGGERNTVVSLLLRQLENEYHKHWQVGVRAN